MSEEHLLDELDDSIFDAYSKKIKEDAAKQKKGGNYIQRTYEDVAYCGLQVGVNTIVRLLGAPPGIQGYTRKPYDPYSFMFAKKLKNQKGERFDLRLPLHEEILAKDHIVHRLAAKVNEIDWVKDPSTGKNKKVYKFETKFPELFDAVNHTGYDAKTDPNGYKYCTGLATKKCVVFNVIDRNDSWCRDNKHTKILVKDLSVLDDGRVFVNSYMPASGFTDVINSKTSGAPELGNLIGKYGNYEKYDIAIFRTGQMNPAYKFNNASKMVQAGMTEELRNEDGSEIDFNNVGSVGPLSSEESKYGRYDLDKIFQTTSYQKIEKNLGWVFKLCDATLGTSFYNELEVLVADEKKRYDEIYRNEKVTEEAEAAQVTVEKAAIKESLNTGNEQKPPVRRSVGDVKTLSDDKIALLKGWSKLTTDQRLLIEDVNIVNGKTVITWKDCDDTKNLLACECECPAPDSFSACPLCGADFL